MVTCQAISVIEQYRKQITELESKRDAESQDSTLPHNAYQRRVAAWYYNYEICHLQAIIEDLSRKSRRFS